METKTYKENGKFYAVLTLPGGHTFYEGPYDTRSKAYYRASKGNR